MEPIKEDGGSGLSLPHPTCVFPLWYFTLNIGLSFFSIDWSLTLKVQPHGMILP